MEEIYDDYDKESERLDTEFLEKTKGVKDRSKPLEKYLHESRKIRKDFEKKYSKAVEKQKREVWKKKKKKAEKEKQKYLEVKHFEFEFNRWEKFKMKSAVFFFNLKRRFKSGKSRIAPRFLLYLRYRIGKILHVSYTDFRDAIDRKFESAKNAIVKFFVWLFKLILEFSKKMLKLLFAGLQKLMFWKKKDSKEGEESKKNEKTEADKPEETKSEV